MISLKWILGASSSTIPSVNLVYVTGCENVMNEDECNDNKYIREDRIRLSVQTLAVDLDIEVSKTKLNTIFTSMQV